jgi:O-antigen ligase
MIADRARQAGGWAAALLGLSIPISIVADNILLAFIAMAWLLSGHLREQISQALRNPVVIAGLLLFALFIAGIFVYDGDPLEAARSLGKYKELLFLLPLVCLFDDATWRVRAFRFFFAAMVITLIGSFAIAIGLIPVDNPPNRYAGNPTVFKFHITQSLLMAMFAFICASLARIETDGRRRWMYISLAILAAANVLLMVKGRTGYVVLLALFVYATIAWYRWKGLVCGMIFLGLASAAVWSLSDTLRERGQLAVSEFHGWVPGEGAKETSSIGMRLDFYDTTLKIIREHPVLGVGTGGFERAYMEKIQGTNLLRASNPHNEYLMIGAQLGIVGVIAFLALLLVLWRLSGRLKTGFERDLARALVITYVLGNLVNSLLLDHTEGMLFCWASAALFAGMPRTGGQRGT